MTDTTFDGESLITPDSMASLSLPTRQSSDEERIRLDAILGKALGSFEKGADPVRVCDRLVEALHVLRGESDPATWRGLVPVARAHPVASILMQDPFTRWSAQKPRGYSGDAHLLDFIYGHECVAREVAEATPMGRAIYASTYAATAAEAVRERRTILGALVDELANEADHRIEVLSVASGHLREASASRALSEGRIGRWVALDQDTDSVGLVAREWAETAVQPMEGSVRGLLGRGYGLGSFDLVYSAGLYDYLAHDVAVRLTRKLLAKVKPGGRLLFANFSTQVPGDGYMETFMDWPLILRTEADLRRIADESAGGDRFETELSYDSNGTVVYATMRHRG